MKEAYARNIVRLKIVSPSLTPEEISKRIGIDCDKCWKAGDRRGRPLMMSKANWWMVHSSKNEKIPLKKQLDLLLKRLAPFSEKIRALSENGNKVEFSCVVYDTHVPGLNFKKDILEAIARLGGSLDIDLYIID
jgi:hypothetical protein